MKILSWLVLLFWGFQLMAQTDTQVRMVRPFTKGGQQAEWKARKSLHGQCGQQSKVSMREDAWRCSSGTTELDPCFMVPGSDGKRLLCPLSPWHSEASEIEVTHIMSNATFESIDMNRGKPWGVLLANGLRCLAIEESEIIDDQPVSFVCRGGEMLLGKVHRCAAQWSVLWTNGDQIEERFVGEAWF